MHEIALDSQSAVVGHAWDRDTLLRDGSVARIRPISPADGGAWRTFHAGLSERTIYMRFFSPHQHPTDAEVEHFVCVDYRDRMAFVVEQRDAIIGIGRYDRVGTVSAEIAFAVTDIDQGRGVGTLLLEYLVAYATQSGITHFVADTLSDNHQMLGVFRRAGFDRQTSTSSGVTRVILDVSPSQDMRRRVDDLDWQSDSASIRYILEPRGIGIVGASLSGGGIGRQILANIRSGGFSGPVAAINPKVGTAMNIDGVSWFAALPDCPFAIDLVIIAVPAVAVPAVIDQCAAADVHGIVIVSSGFAENGATGALIQDQAMERAHRAGIRVVGPNCLGIVNTAPAVRLNATFAAAAIQPGRVAMASQSGAVGIALLQRTRQMDLGVSCFVSMGNKADVSGNDLLRYWHQDSNTKVILLYLESLGNPRKFFDVARVVGRSKPIVVLKSGRSEVGARAAASHTASLASSDRAADTLFAQAGVIRATTIEEMLAIGSLLDHAPIPGGDRIAIISNAGGAGVLAADSAHDAHLQVPPMSTKLQEQLRIGVAGAAAVDNPIDLGAAVSAATYRTALQMVAQSGDVDAIVAIHAAVPQLNTDAFVQLAAEVAAEVAIPIVAVTLGVDPHDHAPIARFAFPESAVQTLGRVVQYGLWRARDYDEPDVPVDVDRETARQLVQGILLDAPTGRWLEPEETAKLMACYSVDIAPMRWVKTNKAALIAAHEIGFPVALKANVAGLIHKADAGAVVLNLASATEVEATMREFRTRFGSRLRGVVVQAMTRRGVELIVGALRDPQFGPLVLYGSGGTNAELFGDQVLRLAPLSAREAAELVHAPRGARLLDGFRGEPACDVAAVTGVLRRIAQLAFDIHEVAEIECNPLVASAAGAVAVDVRARIAPVPSYAPSWLRAIRSGRHN